jgi:hypothetical protein
VDLVVSFLHSPVLTIPLHRDEWVRATAQSVGPYDGRLHTAALLAGSRLVARTLSTLRQLLDRADTRLFRPQEVCEATVCRGLVCLPRAAGRHSDGRS